jgi:uncharacterized protein with HEPN domain
MPKRDPELYLHDIVESVNAIKMYTLDIDFETFCNDRKTYSATIREYTIIGEAVSHVINVLEEKIPDYPWRMVKDFRNFIVHEYFGVDAKMVWDLTKLELDSLLRFVQTLQR